MLNKDRDQTVSRPTYLNHSGPVENLLGSVATLEDPLKTLEGPDVILAASSVSGWVGKIKI